MAFPIINFKATNTDLEESLADLLEKKLTSLEHFIGEAASICEAEFEKVAPHQSGEVFRVEVNLTIDGKFYRAEATTDSFEKSIDKVRNELDKELRRINDKKQSLVKRGGRKIKEWLRFGS